MSRALTPSGTPSPPNETQSTASWREVSEIAKQAQDAPRLAPQTVTPQGVEILRKEIDGLKIGLEGSSRQTDSTREVDSNPYGCTFIGCSKTFENKNDWKRHETSLHFQEMWRCDHTTPEAGECAKVYYLKESFHGHLKKAHQLDDNAVIVKTELCHIGRNSQRRFWCGFCTKLIDVRARGVDAWTERFRHIDDHFMGRGLARQGIQDWVPVDRARPKEDGDEGDTLEPGASLQ